MISSFLIYTPQRPSPSLANTGSREEATWWAAPRVGGARERRRQGRRGVEEAGAAAGRGRGGSGVEGAQERRGARVCRPPLWPAPYGPWGLPHGPFGCSHGPYGRNPSWACWPKAQAQSLTEQLKFEFFFRIQIRTGFYP